MSQRASEKQPARPQIIEEDAAPPAYHDALHEGSSISSSELSTSTMTDSTFTYDSLPSEASSSSQIGSHPALPVDTKMPLQGNFACLMLVTSDKLRAIAFPPETRALIQMAIRNGWPLGIQEEGELGKTAYSYKLRSGQNMETIASRRLITHLLAALSSTGWHVTMAAELDKKDSSLDSIFFKSGDPLARTFFSVSFSGWDKIRLIDSPNEAVRLRFLRVIQSWPKEVQEFQEKESGVFQIKMGGMPWMLLSTEMAIALRFLMVRLLDAFDELGYELAASVKMSGHDGDHAKIDSWFFGEKRR